MENDLSVFIPNYRKISYASAALATRRKDLTIVGVCHADHISYYKVLQRYQSIISVFVCPSRKTASELAAFLSPVSRSRSIYIPHYIDFDAGRRASFSRDDFTVIYHGRVREEQKHCSEILQVARIACRENVRVRFVLMGDADDSEYYAALISRMGLGKHVALHPSRPWEDVQDVLLKSQLAILTSAYEGFCYGVAEALAAGLPVAAYDCGDVISDFVIDGDTGRLVDWGNARALADWIVTLSKREDLWRDYSTRALHIARKMFDIDQVSRRYYEALTANFNKAESWPPYRPAYVPESGKSIRSFLERSGSKMGLW